MTNDNVIIIVIAATSYYCNCWENYVIVLWLFVPVKYSLKSVLFGGRLLWTVHHFMSPFKLELPEIGWHQTEMIIIAIHKSQTNKYSQIKTHLLV